LMGALLIALAGVNFINLMTARAARRCVEIGVRKVSGAERRDLVVQFIGESAVYVGFAAAAAILVAQLAMPALNTFLDRTMPTPLKQSLEFYAGLAGAAATIAILAGIYPALVLANFRPAAVLRSSKIDASGNVRLR